MKPLPVLTVGALLLGAVWPAYCGDEKPKGGAVALDKDAKQQLRERWTTAMQDLRVPGMAVVAVRGDEVVLLEPLGIRDTEKRPVTPDTYFYIASCTKAFTATVVAQLAGTGKVDLDAPVKKYLPRFQLAEDEWTDKLTVRDLLAHRRGIRSGAITFLDAFTGEITEDRYYHLLKAVRPTGKYGYSNVHFTLAGRVIEALEGKGWRETMEDRLLKPAGMTRTTGFASRMYADKDTAIPLELRGDGWAACAVRKTDRTMHAAGGLGTTATDLGRWLRLNLGGGAIDGKRVVAAESFKELHTRQAESSRKFRVPDYTLDGYGLGWEVGTYKKHKVIRHTGGYDGAAALVAFVPDQKVGVAVVVNVGGPVQPFTELVALDVLNRLLGIDGPDLIPTLVAEVQKSRAAAAAKATDPVPVTAKNLSLPPAAYVGVYENEHWGTLRIENKDGTLALAIGDLPVTVKATTKDAFLIGIEQPPWDSRFVVEDKRAAAVVVRWDTRVDVRFERKGR